MLGNEQYFPFWRDLSIVKVVFQETWCALLYMFVTADGNKRPLGNVGNFEKRKIEKKNYYIQVQC